MNIKKQFRLNTREIKYILSTKNKFFLRGKVLNINFIPQYEDKHYNKFGFGISSKFHKKAVYRNIVRRAFYDLIYKNNLVYTQIDGKYRKIYVILKKDVKLDVKDTDFKVKIRKLLENDLKKLFNFKLKKGISSKNL